MQLIKADLVYTQDSIILNHASEPLLQVCQQWSDPL